MTKKYRNRPAFSAADVRASMEIAPHWLKRQNRHLLEAIPIGQTGVWVTTTWGYVWKRWLEIEKGKGTKNRLLKDIKYKIRSRLVYIKIGTLLVPRFKEVSDLEIAILKNSLKDTGLNINDLGIRLWIDRYYQPILMRVDNLEATIRQQKHIIDTYDDIPEPQTKTFADYFRSLTIERIKINIDRRKNRLEDARAFVEEHIKINRLMLENLLLEISEVDNKVIDEMLADAIRVCEECPMRPVGENIRWAKVSLFAAQRHQKAGRTSKVMKFVEKAIKKMVYPRETK